MHYLVQNALVIGVPIYTVTYRGCRKAHHCFCLQIQPLKPYVNIPFCNKSLLRLCDMHVRRYGGS